MWPCYSFILVLEFGSKVLSREQEIHHIDEAYCSLCSILSSCEGEMRYPL